MPKTALKDTTVRLVDRIDFLKDTLLTSHAKSFGVEISKEELIHVLQSVQEYVVDLHGYAHDDRLGTVIVEGDYIGYCPPIKKKDYIKFGGSRTGESLIRLRHVRWINVRADYFGHIILNLHFNSWGFGRKTALWLVLAHEKLERM